MTPASLPVLIALDWGTTHVRAYCVDSGGWISAPLGVQQVQEGGFPAALAELLGDWASLPVPRLACGMVGSRQGWQEAPYCECPAALADIARGLIYTPGGEAAIVPGLSCRDERGVPDVMRGEETQVLGALDDDAEASTVVIQPGTHSKWCAVQNGRILTFKTFMTGEVFALLMRHSILGRLAEPSTAELDAAAFRRGAIGVDVRRGRRLAASDLCRAHIVRATRALTCAQAPSHSPRRSRACRPAVHERRLAQSAQRASQGTW